MPDPSAVPSLLSWLRPLWKLMLPLRASSDSSACSGSGSMPVAFTTWNNRVSDVSAPRRKMKGVAEAWLR